MGYRWSRLSIGTGLFVFALHLLILVRNTETQTLLPNSCPFNQFRCSDGSACLLSEKLCDGHEDCPSGEDETGNSQWDCSLTTLSTACSSDEFRCRFGGCIPKALQCNGKADCWGATDESTDLCFTRPTRRPQRPQPTTSRIKLTSPFPTHPTATIQISQTIDSNEESHHFPILKPTSTSERPKQSSAVEDTHDTISGQPSSSCEILVPPNGAQVTCELNNFPVKCTSFPSPEGTTAQYRCKRFWGSPKTGSQTASRICQNGQWSRLNKNWKCSLQCGEAGSTATGFIVNGYDSLVGRWPWNVGLFQENPPNSGKFEFFCGGSLISRRSVLTAAHCITKSQTSEKRTDRILALLGKHNRTFNNDDAYVQQREVIDLDIPEYYTPKYYDQDIGIILLDKEAEISERVRPVCLPNDEEEPEPGLRGTLAGWGRWVDRSYPENLQMVELPVVPVRECRKSHSSLAALSRSTTFCAGYKNGTSACDGDSGGGLVFEDNQKYYVQGIVSAGINSHGQGGGCDPQFYTIFTKVGKFRSWIDQVLDQKEGRI